MNLNNMKKTLRSESTQKRYEKEMKKMKGEKGCRFCKLIKDKQLVVVQEFGEFILVHNQYALDEYYSIDDMLLTKRHKKRLTGTQLLAVQTLEERYLDYDYQFANMPKQQSIPDHWHRHYFRR